MKCLILAAGRGSRLQQRADSKPLLPLLGVPLIERTIRAAQAAGADHFIVVTGHAGERVQRFLDTLAQRLGVTIDSVPNPDWAQSENGQSILAAEGLLDEPFLLLMADHLVEPALLRDVLAKTPPPDGVLLAVDGDRHNPLVDPEDVTRVRFDGQRITAIGKGLAPFDGYDTGVFLATPGLFAALREAAAAGESTLTAAVRRLAREGRAWLVRVDGRLWCDVDDPAALARAEKALLARLQGKTNDGPVSRWLNRPLSIRLSRWLVRTPVTPNQISLFSFLLSTVAAGLFMLGGYPALLAGGLLAQFASIIDGCDGEVARLKYLGSDFGGWFDAVLDRYADAFLLFGLTWHLWREQPDSAVLLIGFLAIIGSFMLSYTADKYDRLMAERIASRGWRMGRDVRVFIVFLAALTHGLLAALVVIALVMNLEVVRRIRWVRHA